MIIDKIFLISILQILSYCLGINILFREKVHDIKLGAILLVLNIGLYYLLRFQMSKMLYTYISTIFIFFSIVEGPLLKKILVTMKVVFITGCSEEMIEAVISFVASQLWKIQLKEEIEVILANIILLSIWAIFGIIKKNGFTVKRKYINILIMIVMGVMAAALVLVIACINYAKPYVNRIRFSAIGDILTIISYLSIVILGFFIIYTKDVNENYKHLLETESLLRESQKNNYEMMLAKEEETRVFRHDINNHLICLKDMITSGNIVEANTYVEQMQKAIKQIQMKSYVTGNVIIDSILNYYIQQLERDIEVSVTGLCNATFDINYVDLCSILSNPLQNAVEALNNQKQGKKYLKFTMNSTYQNLKIVICNSIDQGKTIMTNGVLETSKQDKKNHGIGLKRVLKLVEKYHGLSNVEVINNEFRVTIVLPISH